MRVVERSRSPGPRVTLERRLEALMELCLRMKDVSWTVSGPAHLAVHELLEPQVRGVSSMVGDSAARLGMLEPTSSDEEHDGGWSLERPQCLRTWPVDGAIGDLRSLSMSYRDVIDGHGQALGCLSADPVTCTLLQRQAVALQHYDGLLTDHLAHLA